MKVRVPVLRGVATELDTWEANEDGTLSYRFAVDLNGMQCRATGTCLSSEQIHDLTKLRICRVGQWFWTDVPAAFEPEEPNWRHFAEGEVAR